MFISPVVITLCQVLLSLGLAEGASVDAKALQEPRAGNEVPSTAGNVSAETQEKKKGSKPTNNLTSTAGSNASLNQTTSSNQTIPTNQTSSTKQIGSSNQTAPSSKSGSTNIVLDYGDFNGKVEADFESWSGIPYVSFPIQKVNREAVQRTPTLMTILFLGRCTLWIQAFRSRSSTYEEVSQLWRHGKSQNTIIRRSHMRDRSWSLTLHSSLVFVWFLETINRMFSTRPLRWSWPHPSQRDCHQGFRKRSQDRGTYDCNQSTGRRRLFESWCEWPQRVL